MLKYISDMLTELQIPYEFENWTAEITKDPYFVGTYNEVESATLEESGYQEITFILTGTGTKWVELEAARKKIKNNLPKSAILNDHSGIAVYYGYSHPVPTGDAELKRIQINLIIKKYGGI